LTKLKSEIPESDFSVLNNLHTDLIDKERKKLTHRNNKTNLRDLQLFISLNG